MGGDREGGGEVRMRMTEREGGREGERVWRSNEEMT